MADCAISLLVEKVRRYHENTHVREVRHKIGELLVALEKLNGLDEDAYAKKRSGDGSQIRLWLSNARDLANQVEESIDSFKHETEMKRLKPPAMTGGSLKTFLTRYPSKLISCVKTWVQIEGIQQMIRDIDQHIADYDQFRSISPRPAQRPTAGPPPPPANVLGFFDGYKNDILNKLGVDDSHTHYHVLFALAITGMAGIGKTTLADEVYNDSRVRERFEIRAWASASTSPANINALLLTILRAAVGRSELFEEEESLEMDELKHRISQALQERRYLIVLDDICSVDSFKEIESCLPCFSKNGSRVLITTRSMDVTAYIYDGYLYQLPLPDEEQSCQPYQLPLPPDEEKSCQLYQLPLPDDEQSCELMCGKKLSQLPHHLHQFVSDLMRRCGRLPLVLNQIRQELMATENSSSSNTFDQEAALERVLSDMDNLSDWYVQKCLDVLAPSYDGLPSSHMRSCFLSLASFPRDAAIEVSKLTCLWIAEGFIPELPGSSMEETAQSYLWELINSSLVEAVEKDVRLIGTLSLCRIHPVLYDLCINKARNIKFLSNIHSSTDPPRRLLALRSSLREPLPRKLRSLFCIKNTIQPMRRRTSIFSGQKLLRVIELVGVRSLTALPRDIKGMIFLRYLGLRGCTGLTELPSWIGELPCLQTLDIRKTGILHIPAELGETKKLSHLLMSGLECPPNIGSLDELRTLLVASAGGGWLEQSLAKLSNIQVLGIRRLAAAQEDKLVESVGKLENLSSLYLHSRESIPMEQVLELASEMWYQKLKRLHLDGPVTRPPTINHLFLIRLAVLTLEGSKLEQDPMETLKGLVLLEHLTLKNNAYLGKKMVCAATDFMWLKSLRLWCLPELQEWSIEVGALYSLAFLSIGMCGSLAALPEGLQNLCMLKELEVIDSRDGFLKNMREDGKEWYKIKHVPSIKLN